MRSKYYASYTGILKGEADVLQKDVDLLIWR